MIRRMKEEGIDLEDEKMVNERLSLYNEEKQTSVSLPLTLPENVAGTGLRKSIERLEACEVAAHQDYLNALKNDPVSAARYLKNWMTITEQLRKISVDNPSVEKENSKVITKEELALELGELFRNLRQDLDSLPRRISLFTGKSKTDLEAAVKEETNKIIDSLFHCKYLDSAG
jgi:hypothetical protein